MTDKKKAVSKDKIGFCDMPLRSLIPVAAVFQYGAAKYGSHNFRTDEFYADEAVYLDAAFRHIIKFAEGPSLDAESGLPHLAHAVASLLILMDAQMRGMHGSVIRRPAERNPEHNIERTFAATQRMLRTAIDNYTAEGADDGQPK